MKAIIPAAGFGLRLRPHTLTKPKVLLNVAGKPILGHILDSLTKQGINDVILIVGYKSEAIVNYINQHYTIKVQYVVQKEMLGLGHSIWCARHEIGNDPCFIVLGDTIFDFNLQDALKSGYNSLGIKEVDDPRRFGVAEFVGDFIVNLTEKPTFPKSKNALVGLYYIKNTPLLIQRLDHNINNQLKNNNEFQLTDALQSMINEGEKFQGFNVDGWYDCGKFETMISTNRQIIQHSVEHGNIHNSIIIEPVSISKEVTIVDSVIGPFVSIDSGSVVTRSILKDCIISNDVSIKNVIAENSMFGNNSTMESKSNSLDIGDFSTIKQ